MSRNYSSWYIQYGIGIKWITEEEVVEHPTMVEETGSDTIWEWEQGRYDFTRLGDSIHLLQLIGYA